MTGRQFAEYLNDLHGEAKEKFDLALGMGNQADSTIMNNFLCNPAFEKQVCFYLNIPTEAERLAKRNFWVGVSTLVVSVVTLAISLLR